MRTGDEIVHLNGIGYVPRSGLRIHVSARGHTPKSVRVDDQQRHVHVVLERAFLVEGFAYDAVTSRRLAGALVTLEDSKGQRLCEECETNQSGQFRFESPVGGTLVIRGTAAGYLPMSGEAGAAHGGVLVEVQGPARIGVPMRPIYVTLCNLKNATNLEDDVFRSLVACRFLEQPGHELPEWHSWQVLREMSEIAKKLEIEHAYAQARYLEQAPTTLSGSASFVVRGQGSIGIAPVMFRPLAEFRQQPIAVHHVANRQWPTSKLTVEAPIALRVCVGSGAVFGGLPTKPGRFSCSLPNGSYLVSPLDDHALLSAESWKRRIELREPQVLRIAPREGFGTLKITGGDKWPRGVLTCNGNGTNLAIPLENLPFETPASPGPYRFRVIVGSGHSEEVVWTRNVDLAADQENVLRVDTP